MAPPFDKSGGLHGVSAALEFAGCHLEVEHIIVMGHSHCGGINALMAGNCDCKGDGFSTSWMSIAAPAREKVLAELPGKDAKLQQRAVEQASILLSMENLRTFPWVDQRVANATLSLHGWHFDLDAGELLEYWSLSGLFQKIDYTAV